jgi:hypothetical protein
MGFMDKAKEQAAQQQAADQAGRAAAREVLANCPGRHYVTEVNKGSIRMGTWQGHLNEMYTKGYRLAHVLEQDGNTVQVFEHHYH